MEENEKRDINMVAMEVIMNAGDGRDKIDEALAAMAEGKLDEVDKLLEEAEALIVKAHNAQTEVIQSQVSGESMEYSLLFVHAQDTVMTITTELRMTEPWQRHSRKDSSGAAPPPPTRSKAHGTRAVEVRLLQTSPA